MANIFVILKFIVLFSNFLLDTVRFFTLNQFFLSLFF